MNSLRKTFIVSTMFVTVLAMSMVLPAPAGATAQAGDLIKMDGLSSVYYLGADGKRYVFPNETTYFSWYADFSSVVTIPQSELESYPLGANVTMRPGTKLVKITTDPKVYAVEPGGVLKWVPDEDTAKALYGDNWAQRVVDVPDAFFTNYTVSSEQVSADAYPAGSLVKFGDDATVYYIDESGNARAIADEAAFTANRFSWDDVITSTLTKPTEGTAIAAAESGLTDTSEGAGGTAGAGTGLTVTLAGDTAASANLPSYATLVNFITVNLTASNDGAVTVQNMVFTRTGTGDPLDFDGGYLFVGDTRLTTKRSVNSSDNTITFTALNLNIPAGMTKSVTLKMNARTDAQVTGNHAFKLASASAVTTNGAVVSGSFPIQGNLMSYAAVDAATVVIDGSASYADKKVGESNVTLGEFTIQNDSEEIVNIYRIRLKQNGDAGNDAISNLSLDLDGTIVKSDVSMSDKYVDFSLDTPFELKKSKTITATVRGDIVGDINKSVQLYLKNVADVDIRGTAYGDFYSAKITNQLDATSNLSTSNTPSGNEADAVFIKGSEINVAFDGPQAAEIKDDVTDVVLANFKIKTENLDVNIETLPVVIEMHLGGSVSSSTSALDNVEMVDSANNVSYSVSDPTGETTNETVSFENVYLQAGTQYNFQIRGDVPDGLDADTSYKVKITLTDATARFQDENETAVSSSDWSQTSLIGKTMTVAAPSVTFSKVTTNDTTVVKDATGVLLFKGKIIASNVDDLTVSKIKMETGGAAAGQNFSLDFTKLYLYKVNSDSTETLLDSETSLSSSGISFSGFSLNIPKGLSNGVYVVLRADVKSSPTATTTYVQFSDTDSDHTVRDADNNTLTSINGNTDGAVGHGTTVASEGSYTMNMDTEEAGVNNDQNVLAGTISKLGRIKVTATNENAKIEDLVLQNVATNAADSQTLGTLYLYSDSDMTNLLGSADLGTSNLALFDNVNIEIPTQGVTYLYVGGLIKPYDKSSSPGADATAVAGTNIQIMVKDNPATGYDTKVVGVDTGTTLTDSIGTDRSATSTVMGAVMSAITTDFANGTLVNGTAKDIFSFKVTAPDSSNVAYDGTDLGFKLATTTFSYSTSGPAALDISSIKVERISGANGEQTPVVQIDTGNKTIAIGWQNTYGTQSDLIVRPGDTAEYVVRATISGSDGTGDSLQVTIETVDTNVKYFHNTTSASAATSEVSPLISGVSSVRGGTLSN